MIRPLSLYIGLRYTRAKKRNHFVSFISLVSMVGIALGVAVLITVLSVMNGFDEQIKARFFAIAPHVTILSAQSVAKNWLSLDKVARQIPAVVSTAPYVSGKGMITHEGQVAGVSVMGILPSAEQTITQLGDKLTAGKLSRLQPGEFNMIVGQQIADGMNLKIGDKVTLLTPQMSSTPLGIIPRYKRFTLVGVFQVGSGFGYDDSIVFIHMNDADKLFGDSEIISGLHIKLKSLYDASSVSRQLQQLLPSSYGITNWAIQFGAFFNALTMEKTMMFVILLLIVAVAAFNLVASLVMLVNEKRSDIAILRTLGATRSTIMQIFIFQGATVGFTGTVLGIVLGIILSLNATNWVNHIQEIFHVQFISSNVYFVDFLPSRLELWDVVKISSIAFFMSLLATLYPAWQAARTEPAEALRYE